MTGRIRPRTSIVQLIIENQESTSTREDKLRALGRSDINF
jgi:hypothetical protein